LRGPKGCPWDREQDHRSLRWHAVEEAYELMDAIESGDDRELEEELGDLLLQVVFHSQLAKERGAFDLEQVARHIAEKLIRRHPHVFADAVADTPDDVKKRWDEIKAEEKKKRGEGERLLLEAVPRALPALVEAQQIASRAAGAGFDWDNAGQVLEKMHEELDELAQARESADQTAIEDEIGDLFFVLVNIARFLRVDPEQALRKTNAKFRKRFGYVESQLRERGKGLSKSHMDEMEALWQEAKQVL